MKVVLRLLCGSNNPLTTEQEYLREQQDDESCQYVLSVVSSDATEA